MKSTTKIRIGLIVLCIVLFLGVYSASQCSASTQPQRPSIGDTTWYYVDWQREETLELHLGGKVTYTVDATNLAGTDYVDVYQGRFVIIDETNSIRLYIEEDGEEELYASMSIRGQGTQLVVDSGPTFYSTLEAAQDAYEENR